MNTGKNKMSTGKNKRSTDQKEKILTRSFLALMFVFILAWIVLQPLNSSPDEEMRFDVIKYLFYHGTLPRGDNPLIIHPFWGISYAFSPYLSGMLSAALMRIVALFTKSEYMLLCTARIPGALFTVGTIYLAIRMSKRLFTGIFRLLFIGFVALLPQFIFLGSYMNNDAAALFSTALIVYAWVLAMQDGWNRKNSVMLALGMSICLLSYYNAYGFVLCSFFLFVLTILLDPEREKKEKFKRLFGYGALIALLVLLLTGWWFIRNYIIYDGDILGRKISALTAQKYAMEQYKPSNHPSPKEVGFSLWQMITGSGGFNGSQFGVGGWAARIFKSFIGNFGFMNVPIPLFMTYMYFGIYLIGVIGALPQLKGMLIGKKHAPDRHKTVLFHIMMFANMFIPIGLTMYYAYTDDYQAQGRYIMPILIPFVYYITKGYEYLTRRFIKNKKAAKIVITVLLVIMAVILLYAYFGVFLPKYWGSTFKPGYVNKLGYKNR